MPGVRFDRLLTSTAVAILLSGVTIGAVAEPQSGSAADSAMAAPATAAPSAPTSDAPQRAAQHPAPAQESTSPAIPAKPEATSEQPAGTPSKPQADSAQPTAAAATNEQPAAPVNTETPAANPQSAAPVAAEAPAASPQPAAATGGDEVPAIATPAVAATAAPNAVANADAPVTEQLRELANGKFDRVTGGKKERAAIEAFYSGRDYAPLWITDGKPNERATAAISYLEKVGADGLDPADYPVPNFASLDDPAGLAEAEIRLTTSVVAYAHHAQVGRVHWSRVSGDIYYDQKPSTPAEVLAALADSKDVSETLDSYEPHDPGYVALKAKLAELRAGKAQPAQEQIPNGPAPRLGAQDDRVPLLRQRLGVPGNGTTFDKALSTAVKKFQQEHELKVTGTLSTQTIEALNGRQPDRPIDTIIANLERWRWMPHDLGKTYVMVNLPDFTLRVMHDGKELWKTRIVDGKPNMPTPIMSAEMKFITVNPTWNVPPSIVAREYMPVLEQDPSVLERMGLSVSTNPDGTVHISQPPGDKNALGRLRFNFPNKFLVYQHDTPEKHLFAYDRRAFSHGCMRVQDPVKYAEVLLSLVRPRDNYTEEKIRRMFGNSEVDIQFPQFIPVHLTYQTAFVDEEGKLEFRDDIYGRDKVLLAILKSDERKVADIPIVRQDNVIRREALAMPDGAFGRFGGGGFFSRLFGGGSSPPPAPPPQRKRSAQRTEMR